MLLHSLRRPNARLAFAIVWFLWSTVMLVYMFRDSFPTVETRLSPAARKKAEEVKEKQRAAARALEIWQGINASIGDAGGEPPPQEPPFGNLVVAGQEKTDLSWTREVKDRWTPFKYDANKPVNGDPRLRFPKRKGNEAIVYLSYIINHYDHLPFATIFVHGHATAWHQEANITTLISSLDLTQLSRYGFISLRCEWNPSCPAEIRPKNHDALIWGNDPFRAGTEAAVGGNWKLLFPDVKLPETMASPCCAQFAVTREAIRKRERAEYERLRLWLMGTLLDNDMSGRVFEKLWAYIFTGEAV